MALLLTKYYHYGQFGIPMLLSRHISVWSHIIYLFFCSCYRLYLNNVPIGMHTYRMLYSRICILMIQCFISDDLLLQIVSSIGILHIGSMLCMPYQWQNHSRSPGVILCFCTYFYSAATAAGCRTLLFMHKLLYIPLFFQVGPDL